MNRKENEKESKPVSKPVYCPDCRWFLVIEEKKFGFHGIHVCKAPFNVLKRNNYLRCIYAYHRHPSVINDNNKCPYHETLPEKISVTEFMTNFVEV